LWHPGDLTAQPSAKRRDPVLQNKTSYMPITKKMSYNFRCQRVKIAKKS